MPSSATQATTDLVESVSKLKINPGSNKTVGNHSKPKTKKKVIADSWEDEEISSSGSDSEDTVGEDSRPSTSAGAGTQAPPPTPISPTYGSSPGSSFVSPTGSLSAASSPPSLPQQQLHPDSNEPRRPEKTDAVARRMIAGALGVKVPKQTEDQKAYDKAMREKERKRREEEREVERKRLEEVERAKRAVWED